MTVDEVELGGVLERFGDVQVFGDFGIDGRVFFIPAVYDGVQVTDWVKAKGWLYQELREE